MLLLRDDAARSRLAQVIGSHTDQVRALHAGAGDLTTLWRDKLAATLDVAAKAPLYEGRLSIPDLSGDIGAALGELPPLAKKELASSGMSAFTRQMRDFLHYYESSGTTGDPVAAPKAMDDLSVNTINIGEMWARFLEPDDVGLILINAPFAPAAYQFEKVLEYLGIMSLRPWVDNITGDYTRVLRLVTELDVNVFVGPPSRLLEMVQFASRRGLPWPRFERLLLMAEQTGPGFLRHLERITGARAYVCSYGSSETGTTAVTCEESTLHLQLQSYLLELSGEDGTRLIAPGGTGVQRGELVVTTLDIPARPLIRYQTGDLVEIDHTPCACGLPLPVLRTLGRAQDVLLLDGAGIRQNELEHALWGEPLAGATVFNYMLVVRGGQIVLLVTADGSPDGPWTDELAGRIRPMLPGCQLVVRVADRLPPLASLGQYLGWKLSRVLDLSDQRNWARLPEPVGTLVRQTLDEIGEGG